MFFTQDDYKKIQQWLIQNSVKDTEFNEAMSPLNGYETVALVQNGTNVKFNIKELLEQLTLLGDLDFINITEAYNERMITLLEAVQLIPYKARKIGQVVTFINEEGKWVIYQYQGSNLSQWNIEDFWVDLLQKLGGLDTLVDEEDLTIANKGDDKVIKFKDKSYNPEEFSGLGRVILRKNLVDIEDPENRTTKRVNLLTQNMVSKENTIYVIQYDFDLNGEEITIPEGCVLDFQGGSFDNGTIVGNSTMICAIPIKIFSVDIILSGTWNVLEAYPEWFGAKGDESNDDRPAIQKCLNTFKITKFSDKVYLLSSCTEDNFALKMREGTKIIGTEKGKNNYFASTTLKSNSVSIIGEDIIILGVNRHCEVRDLVVEGTKKTMDFEKTNKCCGISGVVSDNYKITLYNVQARFVYYGFNLSCWMSTFIKCAAKGCKYGFFFHGFKSGTLTGYLDIESEDTTNVEITSNVIQQCYCNDCVIRGFILYKTIYSTMISCAADGTGTFNRNNWQGYPPEMEKVTDANTNAAYSFWNCKGITVTGCGSEGCHKLIESKQNVGMEISNMMVYIAQHGLDNYNYTKWIYSEDDINVHIKNINFYCIPWKIDNTFVYIQNSNNPSLVSSKVLPVSITLENIIDLDYGNPLARTFITTSNLVDGSLVVLKAFNDEETIDITKEKNPGLGSYIYNAYDASGSLKNYYKISSTPREIKYYIPDGGNSGAALRATTVKGNKGRLVFYSDDNTSSKSNLHVLNSEVGCTFENFDSILFDNIRLYPYNNKDLNYILKFNNCGNVIFRNCKILNHNNFENVIKQFEVEGNTTLTFYNITLRDNTFYPILFYKDGKFINYDNSDVELVKII